MDFRLGSKVKIVPPDLYHPSWNFWNKHHYQDLLGTLHHVTAQGQRHDGTIMAFWYQLDPGTQIMRARSSTSNDFFSLFCLNWLELQPCNCATSTLMLQGCQCGGE